MSVIIFETNSGKISINPEYIKGVLPTSIPDTCILMHFASRMELQESFVKGTFMEINNKILQGGKSEQSTKPMPTAASKLTTRKTK